MDEDAEFFYQVAAATARELPIGDAIQFLRGLLYAAPDAPKEFLAILSALRSSDEQLDLIEIGKLNLDRKAAKR